MRPPTSGADSGELRSVPVGFGIAIEARAQLSIGTWVKKTSDKGPGLMMTIEPCCGRGRRILYRVTGRDTVTVLKMNGKRFATSRAELSADGRTLTVENETSVAAGGQTVGKQTEIWVKQ